MSREEIDMAEAKVRFWLAVSGQVRFFRKHQAVIAELEPKGQTAMSREEIESTWQRLKVIFWLAVLVGGSGQVSLFEKHQAFVAELQPNGNRWP